MTEPSRESAAPQDAPYPPPPASASAAWPYAPQRRAPKGLAIASIAVAIGLTALLVVTAVAAWPAAREFREAAELGRSTLDVFTVYDGLGLLLIPAVIAAYVVSCLWLQAARTNTITLEPHGRHQRGSVWVWLGWWVPIVSFWFPYQVVRDVQYHSVRRTGARRNLALWWAPWLVYTVSAYAINRATGSQDLGMIDALPVLETVAATAAVLACIQWCRIVHTITANQEAALSSR